MPTPDYENDLAFEPRKIDDLTILWKAKKLDTTQRYWVIEDGFSVPIPRLMNEDGDFIDGTGYPIPRRKIKAVLDSCDYDHFVELTEKAKKYDSIIVNGNYPDKISKLKSKIKHLLELQANQDKEIETFKEDQEKMVRGAKRMLDFQSQTIEQLRQLLKESYNELKILRMLSLPIASKEALMECDDLLTRINEVLK